MKRLSAKTLQRRERERALSAESNDKLRAVLASIPEPPPDPRQADTVEEAEVRVQKFAEWQRALTDDQRDAIQVARRRFLVQSMRGAL